MTKPVTHRHLSKFLSQCCNCHKMFSRNSYYFGHSFKPWLENSILANCWLEKWWALGTHDLWNGQQGEEYIQHRGRQLVVALFWALRGRQWVIWEDLQQSVRQRQPLANELVVVGACVAAWSQRGHLVPPRDDRLSPHHDHVVALWHMFPAQQWALVQRVLDHPHPHLVRPFLAFVPGEFHRSIPAIKHNSIISSQSWVYFWLVWPVTEFWARSKYPQASRTEVQIIQIESKDVDSSGLCSKVQVRYLLRVSQVAASKNCTASALHRSKQNDHT